MKIKKLLLGPVLTNCYICGKNTGGFVVDPAADAKKIYDEINKQGLNIKYIIITHAHFDHIEAAQKLKELTNAKIIASKIDFAALNDSTLNLADMFGAEVSHIDCDMTVEDGDTLEFDGFSLKFIITPGHTLGSMCILVDNEILFSGDTLFALSVGRTDFPGGSFKSIEKSVKRLFLLEENIKVYPGHNEPTSIGEEKRCNPFVNGEDA